MSATRITQRLDKWLWHARFFKTRTLAAKVVSGGHVRVNAQKVSKASTAIGAGDTLTFPQGNRIRVVEIAALAERRGPAVEAQTLYLDHTPEPEPSLRQAEIRVGARPTKKERRKMDGLKDGFTSP